MQNKRLKRTSAIALIMAVALTTSALASVLGELINGHETFLGGGMELSKGVYWTGSDYRTENYIEYTPSAQVYPVVVSGSKVCNSGSFKSMAALIEQQGKHVIAGINGDYFVMANNEPLGIVVENGKLLSTDAGNWAVGFMANGSAIIGKPAVNAGIELPSGTITLSGINKTRKSGQAMLYTEDYAAATKNKGDGADYICSMNGTLSINGMYPLTVEEIKTQGGAVAIPAGKVVLSIAGDVSEEIKSMLPSLTVGSTMTLKVSCQPEWANVRYALGSLYKLVSGGKAEGGLEAGAAPRTAVGIKADGSLVFYTMDGRQSGSSVGVSMTQLAQRMIELGCVEATIMDGGGSTSLNAIYIGDSSASQINSPSEGYQRAVTNYIMLVTDAKPTGKASRLAIYPLSTNILSGAETSFVVKAADENGYAAQPEGYVTLSASSGLGTISPDGKFVASGEGSGSITASGTGLVSAAVNVKVVKTPDIVRVFREGSSAAVSSLSVATGSTTSLTANAMDKYVYLISQDRCYNWSVTGNIGTIDQAGTFTAGAADATGSIVVSAGERTVTIPVTVVNPEKFDDVKPESWYYDAVKYVGDKGLMDGTGVRIFDPDKPTSRAMAVTVLYRLAGSPQPTGGQIFADVPADQWYSNAIAWAAEKGIAQGDAGYFNPNVDITREQLAAILYRYRGMPSQTGSLETFTDASQVSDWARDAISWAVQTGLITGINDTTLSPKTNATRAQLATTLQRMG